MHRTIPHLLYTGYYGPESGRLASIFLYTSSPENLAQSASAALQAGKTTRYNYIKAVQAILDTLSSSEQKGLFDEIYGNALEALYGARRIADIPQEIFPQVQVNEISGAWLESNWNGPLRTVCNADVASFLGRQDVQESLEPLTLINCAYNLLERTSTGSEERSKTLGFYMELFDKFKSELTPRQTDFYNPSKFLPSSSESAPEQVKS